ncbi:MAG: hypothetical protein J6T70_15220 [Bacteroidales bacterium]|nr:hypothetical protein [Bacteroidales bacterium]
MKTSHPTVFNDAQLYLLDVFSDIKTDKELLDIKKLISDYYAKKLDTALDDMWQSGELDQKRLDEINELDLHSWLNEQRKLDKVK